MTALVFIFNVNVNSDSTSILCKPFDDMVSVFRLCVCQSVSRKRRFMFNNNENSNNKKIYFLVS